LQVGKPMSGEYKLQVMATQAGGYAMDITISDKNDKIWFSNDSNVNLDRIVSPGKVYTYEVSFDHNDINNLHITKEVTSSELKTSTQAASDLNWIDNKGVLNSLMQKLENAEAAFARGQDDSAVNMLNAFINEINAQRGKHIKAEAADMLISDAQAFIQKIQ
jgi:hypothetical protein